MKLSLGIDIGSSSTKAAALDEHGTLLGTLQVHADDPRTSAYGVLGRFLNQQGASFDDVEKIVLTGSLASLAPAAKTFDIFNQMHDVFGIDYIIPPHPSFATAVGALLCDPLPEK